GLEIELERRFAILRIGFRAESREPGFRFRDAAADDRGLQRLERIDVAGEAKGFRALEVQTRVPLAEDREGRFAGFRRRKRPLGRETRFFLGEKSGAGRGHRGPFMRIPRSVPRIFRKKYARERAGRTPPKRVLRRERARESPRARRASILSTLRRA